jgi:putative addiction module component (TIGR02574 family)
MSPTMKAPGIDRLSIPERILLVEEIWDSIAESPEEVALTEVQRAELDRRLAAHEADPQAGSTWEEVQAELWGRP